ncbi:hypothetical protein [Serratia sarumanii]|uniref:hypothetical protein n=1 Tax=Serratia sarumanii TaxID=3020826 RepID=UPI003F7DF6E7
MKRTIVTITLTISALLSGCAVQNDKTQFHGLGLTYQSNIKTLVNGDYMAEVEAAPAAGRINGAIGTASKKASDFCKVKNKAMKEIITEIDTHLLVNGVARLTFQCI